jgi:hypothetical protein
VRRFTALEHSLSWLFFFTRTGREGMRIQRMEDERRQHMSPEQ